MAEATSFIVETAAGQLFQVRELSDVMHVWMGFEVKRVKGGFAPKAKARDILVRKIGSRVVAQVSA